MSNANGGSKKRRGLPFVHGCPRCGQPLKPTFGQSATCPACDPSCGKGSPPCVKKRHHKGDCKNLYVRR